MKNVIPIGKSLMFFSMVLLSEKGLSQVDIINKTLIVQDSSVLYIGIANAIQIVNTKNPFFEIRSASGRLRSTGNPFIFELRPAGPGSDTVYLFDGNEVLLKKAFKAVYLPPIEAKLGTLRKEEATQEEIYINGWLVLTIPNCTCKTSFEVSSFEIEFDGEDVNEEIMKIEGDRVTTKARKIIKNLKSGDVVYFDNIKAKNDDGRVIDVPGFSITVKTE
jgi:hypothetical protein